MLGGYFYQTQFKIDCIIAYLKNMGNLKYIINNYLESFSSLNEIDVVRILSCLLSDTFHAFECLYDNDE